MNEIMISCFIGANNNFFLNFDPLKKQQSSMKFIFRVKVKFVNGSDYGSRRGVATVPDSCRGRSS